jgi:hypothetical protein
MTVIFAVEYLTAFFSLSRFMYISFRDYDILNLEQSFPVCYLNVFLFSLPLITVLTDVCLAAGCCYRSSARPHGKIPHFDSRDSILVAGARF